MPFYFLDGISSDFSNLIWMMRSTSFFLRIIDALCAFPGTIAGQNTVGTIKYKVVILIVFNYPTKNVITSLSDGK